MPRCKPNPLQTPRSAESAIFSTNRYFVIKGTPVKAGPQRLEIGKAEVVADGTDVALIGLGTLFEMAERTKLQLEARGLSVALINPRFIKPLDAAVIQTDAAIATELPSLGALADTGLGGWASLERAGESAPLRVSRPPASSARREQSVAHSGVRTPLQSGVR